MITYPNGVFGATQENLISTPGVWVLVKYDDTLVAGMLCRNRYGNKLRMICHDGTSRGKREVKTLLRYAIAHGVMWGEISGKLEAVMLSMGAPKIPNTDAERLLGLPVIELHSDGYYYTREVAPGVIRKEVLLGVFENEVS